MPALKEKAVPGCPETFDKEHIRQYEADGYLAFENVLTPGEVEEARVALTELTQGLIEDARQGRAEILPSAENATRNYAGVRFKKPGSPFNVHFEAEVDPLSMDPHEAELKVRKLAAYHQEHPCFVRLVNHPKIQGFVSSLLGYDALLKDEMALSKPPFIGSEKPWHQDNAYFIYLPLDSIITAWITLDDATVENGCMHVVPGAHKEGGLKHFHGIDCEIVKGRLDPGRAVPVEMKAGGAMFFSGMLPHQTPPNRSPERRRALQFQYRGSNTRAVAREEYDRVFVEADGSPASCAAARD